MPQLVIPLRLGPKKVRSCDPLIPVWYGGVSGSNSVPLAREPTMTGSNPASRTSLTAVSRAAGSSLAAGMPTRSSLRCASLSSVLKYTGGYGLERGRQHKPKHPGDSILTITSDGCDEAKVAAAPFGRSRTRRCPSCRPLQSRIRHRRSRICCRSVEQAGASAGLPSRGDTLGRKGWSPRTR
jgi:hypothetical protein